MSSVTFVDYSEKIKEKLDRKLEGCIRAAAVSLSASYKDELQANMCRQSIQISERFRMHTPVTSQEDLGL